MRYCMIPKKPALGLDPRADTGFRKRSCFNNKIERDDDSKKSHRALVTRFAVTTPGFSVPSRQTCCNGIGAPNTLLAPFTKESQRRPIFGGRAVPVPPE